MDKNKDKKLCNLKVSYVRQQATPDDTCHLGRLIICDAQLPSSCHQYQNLSWCFYLYDYKFTYLVSYRLKEKAQRKLKRTKRNFGLCGFEDKFKDGAEYFSL